MMSADSDDLDIWREVHATLLKAVRTAQEGVAAQRAQRRYWLEEICSNLTNEGKHTTNSVWKKPIKKIHASSRTSGGVKRKKKDTASIESKPKARKQKQQKDLLSGGGDSVEGRPKKIKISLKDKRSQKERKEPQVMIESEEESDDDNRDYRSNSPSPNSDYRPGSAFQESGSASYAEAYQEYPLVPSQHPHHQWGAPHGGQSFPMMGAVPPYGPNTGPYPPPPHLMHQPYADYAPPAPPHYYGGPPPGGSSLSIPPQQQQQSTYPKSGSRTYSSIQDVVNSDDESDGDQGF